MTGVTRNKTWRGSHNPEHTRKAYLGMIELEVTDPQLQKIKGIYGGMVFWRVVSDKGQENCYIKGSKSVIDEIKEKIVK